MASNPYATNYDDFIDCCQNSESYPAQLIKSRYGAARREEMAQSLNERAKLVFNPDEGKSVISLTEICACSDGRDPSSSDLSQQAAECHCEPDIINIRARDALVRHLQTDKPNPRLRYLSIQSPSSRHSLNCSLSKFKYFSTYHDIPPSFLDYAYSFKASLSPCDYNLAGFKDENTLLEPKPQILPIDRLKRSGREIRYSFLLRSIENSTSIPSQSWSIRQLAVYHSFDVISGRALWVTCKGNSLIEARIKEALSQNPAFEPNELKSVPNAFAATLEILLMILDWCDDNWRWYINNVVEEVGRPTDKATTIKVVGETNVDQVQRLVTRFSANAQATETLPRSPTSAMRSDTSPRDLEEGTTSTQHNSPLKSIADIERNIGNLQALKIFSLNELQKLQRTVEMIQSALLVLKLNHQAIKQIREHYESLMDNFQTPEMDVIRKNCKHVVLRLSCRSRDVEVNIEARQAQLDTLLYVVQEGKSLYDGILQYKNLQINKIYAESAQQSAQELGVISHKSEEVSHLLHKLAVVGIVFLPVTLLASIFSIQWPDRGGRKEVFNRPGFAILMVGSLGLIMIIAIWLFAGPMLRRNRNAKTKQR